MKTDCFGRWQQPQTAVVRAVQLLLGTVAERLRGSSRDFKWTLAAALVRTVAAARVWQRRLVVQSCEVAVVRAVAVARWEEFEAAVGGVRGNAGTSSWRRCKAELVGGVGGSAAKSSLGEMMSSRGKMQRRRKKNVNILTLEKESMTVK